MLDFSRGRGTRRAAVPACLALCLCAPATAAEPEDGGTAATSYQFAGYAKALALRSRTTDAERDPYGLGLGRLRLKLTALRPGLEARIEHDTELRVGSYLGTAEFARLKDAPPPQVATEQANFSDTRRLYGSNRFFRAHVKFKSDAADFTLGRQRIPLGTGRLWSALDLLNPVNPLQVERDEYVGVDAAVLGYRLGRNARTLAVYAPDPAKRRSRWNLRHMTRFAGADLSLTYAKYWEDRLLGVDLSTQIGDAGLRGEFSVTRPGAGPSHRKALLGLDYGFANTLTLSWEYFHSSQRDEDRRAAFARNPLLAQVQPAGGRYLGLAAGYDITPLLKLNGYWLANLQDSSRFVSATVSYSLTEDTQVSAGAQFFLGDRRSDYGRGENLYFLQLQRFF